MAIPFSTNHIDYWLANLNQHTASRIGLNRSEFFERLIQVGGYCNDGTVEQRHPFTRLEAPAVPLEITANGVGDLLVLFKLIHDDVLGVGHRSLACN